MKQIFNLNEYNSSDGMMTSIWGPSMWHILHTISFNYPINPTTGDKKKYYNFIKSLQYILPCSYCRKNLPKNLKCAGFNYKTSMKNRKTFSKAIYNLHECVNKMLHKKSKITYAQVRDRYEQFRSRCVNNKEKLINPPKSKKEKGCIIPYYGVKSKCVLRIVPRKKNIKSFSMDKKCIVRKVK